MDERNCESTGSSDLELVAAFRGHYEQWAEALAEWVKCKQRLRWSPFVKSRSKKAACRTTLVSQEKESRGTMMQVRTPMRDTLQRVLYLCQRQVIYPAPLQLLANDNQIDMDEESVSQGRAVLEKLADVLRHEQVQKFSQNVQKSSGGEADPPIKGNHPSAVDKAVAVYRYALEVIPEATDLSYAELHAAIQEQLNLPRGEEIDDESEDRFARWQEVKQHFPPNPETFATYLRRGGIKRNGPRAGREHGSSIAEQDER